jgi:hypothetical protein
MEYLQGNNIILADVPAGERRTVYDAFHTARSEHILPIFNVIDRNFYWVSGQYRMSLELRTTRPPKNYIRSYAFSLSESDSNLLRVNVITTMLVSCNISQVLFNFAYPEYPATPTASSRPPA